MGLRYALDELYASGWSSRTIDGCCTDDQGRRYPSVERVQQEFSDAGLSLTLTHVQLFDCYRAEWADGAVVGHTIEEAAVFALARYRKSLVAETV